MIDKDIEIVKKIIDKNKDIVEHFKRDTFSNFPIEESENEIQSIENVLEELETKIGQTHLLSEEVYCLNLKIDEGITILDDVFQMPQDSEV